MTPLSRRIVHHLVASGPRFLPFADAASPDLPLRRLLRLALFQVSVGMALTLLVGTLNRVMIVELGVPTALVAMMVALPVLYAPVRALIGFRSDHHRSALGWRRVPFIWMGTLIQFGGLAMMPFALLVLSGGGNAEAWPAWIGHAGAALAFLLVGAGLHTTQTAGLALATDQATPEQQPKVVGLMYVMLLAGTIVSAAAFGAFLAEFTPGRLVQVIQAAAVITLVLNAVAMWKQEPRSRDRAPLPAGQRAADPSFREALGVYLDGDGARARLVAIGVGTMAFAMQDVLLEPYGGQVLGLGVGQTTWLTAALAAGGLVGFSLASAVLARGFDAARMSWYGAMLGVPAFAAVIAAAAVQSTPLFAAGVLLIGLAGGLFGHGTLTLTMARAPKAHTGLALGAWGAVQATAAGVAVAAGGLMRDVVDAFVAPAAVHAAAATPVSPAGYIAVYATEIVLLLLTVVLMRRLVVAPRKPPGWQDNGAWASSPAAATAGAPGSVSPGSRHAGAAD